MDERNSLMDDHPFSGRANVPCHRKYKNHLLVGTGIILVLAVVVGLIVGLTLKARPSADGLASAVTVKNIMGHLQEFQIIANKYGNRAVLGGYDASLDYVRTALAKTGCQISTQTFAASMFYEHNEPSMSYTIPERPTVQLQPGVDFRTMRYGGNGTYALAGKTVSVVPNAGCNETDWANVASTIALVSYQAPGLPDCTPYQKATLGAKHGASAILIANDLSRTALSNTRIRNDGYNTSDYLVQVPVMSISYSLSRALSMGVVQLSVSLNTNTSIIVANTQNLYCTTPGGNADNLIVIGAHLDGVPEGPGINDNGSGSATLLEIVLQYFKLRFKSDSKIQFSWWGAEEVGLLGSRAFVNSAKLTNTPVRFDSIKMATNFDMLASPNGIAEYHEIGNDHSFPAGATMGSNAITAAFKNAFMLGNVATAPAAMTPGSDYYPFVLEGIPSGGLKTGAGNIKSSEERTLYGGLANAAMDPCYHKACDSIENIGEEMLGFTSQAAARAIATFALEKDINKFLALGGAKKP